MPLMGTEPIITASKRAKTIDALEYSATVNGGILKTVLFYAYIIIRIIIIIINIIIFYKFEIHYTCCRNSKPYKDTRA
jgi:hypothetical protein